MKDFIVSIVAEDPLREKLFFVIDDLFLRLSC